MGLDFGAALAEHTGAALLHVHYNSGRHISESGEDLSQLLEALVSAWPAANASLSALTHSMGGLVLRSACDAAFRSAHTWPMALKKGVFLGTPHLGAPLERLGKMVDWGLLATTYSRAFASLGKIRSAGVSDLGLGILCKQDWDVTDDQAVTRLPLPASVEWYAAAALLAAKPEGALTFAAKTLGDGLVPLDSALGANFEQARTWLGYNMSHLDLLRDQALLAQLKLWLT
jgi:hypothetical protein